MTTLLTILGTVLYIGLAAKSFKYFEAEIPKVNKELPLLLCVIWPAVWGVIIIKWITFKK